MNPKQLSIVIPTYNEEPSIGAAITRVVGVARKLRLEYEVIVVNDGSRDRSGEIAQGLTNLYPRPRVVEHFPSQGYGGALKAGFAKATGEWVAFAERLILVPHFGV